MRRSSCADWLAPQADHFALRGLDLDEATVRSCGVVSLARRFEHLQAVEVLGQHLADAADQVTIRGELPTGEEGFELPWYTIRDFEPQLFPSHGSEQLEVLPEQFQTFAAQVREEDLSGSKLA